VAALATVAVTHTQSGASTPGVPRRRLRAAQARRRELDPNSLRVTGTPAGWTTDGEPRSESPASI